MDLGGEELELRHHPCTHLEKCLLYRITEHIKGCSDVSQDFGAWSCQPCPSLLPFNEKFWTQESLSACSEYDICASANRCAAVAV